MAKIAINSKRAVTEIICVWCLLVMFGCIWTGKKTTDLAVGKPIVEPDLCIANLIDNANFEASDKNELKPGLSVAVPGAATVGINIHYVSDETIKMQVSRNKDPFNIQMALAINLAECMDRKTAEFMKSETFKKLPEEEQDKFQLKSYEVTSKYRAQCLEMILAKAGQKVEVPKTIAASINSEAYRVATLKAALSFLSKDKIQFMPAINKLNSNLPYLLRK